ncbi:MAG: UvrD-helicase domain-containing protein [Magnetococcales bacterium]|nr:UvrD-helicase domain-containing protein [Magnetococcales bacterium]MBF0150884.1 UvrD-helicase domain-containing protein [Magnetococcales bacterium]MBF0172683.1 UvrD-helicase domain-containing protein [Magnetococcales bacterium]MBF0348024.1 UvrD-helicase domain-containing protein [Magnetococcales bacterium]
MNTLLDHLNPPQIAAVTAAAGPVMILAGAGSGKTRVLTRRLAWLLSEHGVAPDEVLAVTFTNKAAREMRNRVTELIHMDEEVAKRLWIGTFHGMSARILRQNAEKIGFNSNFLILDAADQERLIRRLTEEHEFSHVYWTPKRLASTFSRWKDAGLGPEDITEEHVRFPQDRVRVGALFVMYQAELLKSNCMDFGDLLVHCLKLWQRFPETLDRYRFRFRHILVDEYQDTNKVQYDWMRALASHHGNLCVVGDDDQSIYSWRGARIDNILNFENDFPNTTVIRLEQNYRSTGNILKAASHLIDHNDGRMGKTLWTDGPVGPKVVRYTADNGEDEARFVASEIGRTLGSGVSFGHAAILVRAAHQTRIIEDALNRHQIPYQVVGGLRFMERAEIKDALAYLRLAHSRVDDLAFERIINTPKRKLGDKAMATIQQAAREREGSLFAGARVVVAENRLGKATTGPLAEFVALIEKAAGLLDSGYLPGEVLEFLLKESGYQEWVQTGDRGEERFENIIELKSFLQQETDLAGFMERVVLDADPADAAKSVTDSVVLSTLHAAKGLEFPLVFLVGMEEGLLPHKLALNDEASGVEEERRLAYVGMTRAKERLYLCHARQRFMFNRNEPALPSRFLKEIPAEVVEHRGLRVAARSGLGGFPPRRRF